jgi:hypothetical protein
MCKSNCIHVLGMRATILSLLVAYVYSFTTYYRMLAITN